LPDAVLTMEFVEGVREAEQRTASTCARRHRRDALRVPQ
jgi:hypothetical protein